MLFLGLVVCMTMLKFEDFIGRYGCHISIKLEGVALKDCTLVGGIRPSFKSITADSLRTVVFPKKVLEKYLMHNRV